MALPGQKKGKENDANGKPWLRVLKYLPFIRNCFVETSWKKQLPSRKAWYCLPSPAVSFTSYYYYGYVACTAIAASRVSNPFSLYRKDGSDVTLSVTVHTCELEFVYAMFYDTYTTTRALRKGVDGPREVPVRLSENAVLFFFFCGEIC